MVLHVLESYCCLYHSESLRAFCGCAGCPPPPNICSKNWNCAEMEQTKNTSVRRNETRDFMVIVVPILTQLFLMRVAEWQEELSNVKGVSLRSLMPSRSYSTLAVDHQNPNSSFINFLQPPIIFRYTSCSHTKASQRVVWIHSMARTKRKRERVATRETRLVQLPRNPA